jgi:hypothetical protein
MRLNSTVTVLGIALAITAGLLTANISGLVGSTNTSKADSSVLFTGHVETILRDADGNVKAYRQSDNAITNTGENCALRLLFQLNTGASGTSVCTGALTVPWHVIGIGTGTIAGNNTQVSLVSEITAAQATNMVRGVATTKLWTNSTTTEGSPAAKIQLSKQFTNNGASPIVVAESGLFNSTTDNSADSMFARQSFTGITVNVGDSLTVQWTINVGGTGTITGQSG